MSDEVTLKVGGRAFGGWKSIRVARTIEAVAGSFDLTVTDACADHPDRFKLAPGASVVLMIGSDILITGYIDAVSPSLSATARSISVRGRCKTGDMVDCSATAKTYTKQNLVQLCTAIADGFGVSFSINGTDTTIETFTVAPGEKIYAAIERAARARGVFLVGSGKGNVTITAPGSTLSATRIVEGVNLLSISGDFTANERFATYEIIGHGGGGWNAAAVSPQTATDTGARAPRKLVIAEDGLPADLATKRIQWEAATRAARATKLQGSLVGWRQDSGELWRPNILVSVVSPSIGVDGKFLISGVTFSKSDSGTITTLDLKPRGSFAVHQQIDKKEGVKWTQ